MAFNEALHPRVPGGATAGQFTSGGSGAAAAKGAAGKKAAGKSRAAGGETLSFDGKRGTGYGKKGGDARVKRLQQALNRLGLKDMDGKALVLDGKLGPRTTAAVKAAQRKLGVKADGKVTPELLAQLTKAKTLTPAKPVKAAPAKPAAKRPAGGATTAPRQPRPATRPAPKPAARRSEEVATLPGSLTYARTFALDNIEISRSHSDGRTVEAYAAVFNTPAEVRDVHGHYTEVISPSAFAKTLVERAHKVGVFYNHGYNLAGQPDMLGSVPIGTPVEIKADGRGLFTVTRYNRSPLAESVLEAIRNGDIRGQSFRGRIYQSTPLRVPRSRAGEALPVVTRTELGLTEYGPTPSPVYDQAAITAVRAEQIVASIAGLSDEEREELLRMLTPTTPAGPGTSSATPDPGAGTEEPRTAHSGRLTIRRALLRAEMTRKGVRRG